MCCHHAFSAARTSTSLHGVPAALELLLLEGMPRPLDGAVEAPSLFRRDDRSGRSSQLPHLRPVQNRL